MQTIRRQPFGTFKLDNNYATAGQMDRLRQAQRRAAWKVTPNASSLAMRWSSGLARSRSNVLAQATSDQEHTIKATYEAKMGIRDNILHQQSEAYRTAWDATIGEVQP